MVQLHEAEARSRAAAGAWGEVLVGGPRVHWTRAGIRAAGQEGQVDCPVPPLPAGLVGGIHAVTYAVTYAVARVDRCVGCMLARSGNGFLKRFCCCYVHLCQVSDGSTWSVSLLSHKLKF